MLGSLSPLGPQPTGETVNLKHKHVWTTQQRDLPTYTRRYPLSQRSITSATRQLRARQCRRRMANRKTLP